MDVLRLPFQLPLRAILELPSCFYKGRNWTGCVGYSIEVVGVRSAFRFNKRVSLPLSVIPPNARGAELSQGWLPARRVVEFKKAIRRGIWGEFSTVQARVSSLTSPDTES